MPFADISFGLYPSFKGEEERKQKCLYERHKRKDPLKEPLLSFPLNTTPLLPFSLPPPSTCLCLSGLTCLSVHSRRAGGNKNVWYHLADVQKLDLKIINRTLLSPRLFRAWEFLLWSPQQPSCPGLAALQATPLTGQSTHLIKYKKNPLLCHFKSFTDRPLPSWKNPNLIRAHHNPKWQLQLSQHSFPLLSAFSPNYPCFV